MRFHPPGNHFNPDYKYMHVQPYMSNDVDLNNEIFEVLDYDGVECKNYNSTYSRDYCLENYMHEKTLEKFGCTTPYLANKQNVCVDQSIAMKAFEHYK